MATARPLSSQVRSATWTAAVLDRLPLGWLYTEAQGACDTDEDEAALDGVDGADERGDSPHALLQRTAVMQEVRARSSTRLRTRSASRRSLRRLLRQIA